MKKWLVSGLCGLFAIYVVALPYITVNQIKSAVEKSDATALADHIDFPSVRQSLKDQMNAIVMEKMSSSEMKNNTFAALGMAFSGALVDKMVEAYVTPSGIAQLMSGENSKNNRVTSKNDTKTQENKSNKLAKEKPLSKASMSYKSLSRFEILVEKEDKNSVKIIMHRKVLEWKITEIILPRES